MKDNKVWKPVPKSLVPKGAKILSTTWAMKLKASGARRARVNARGFEQKPGIHYKPDDIVAPVVNETTVRVIFTIGLETMWTIWILDIKGAFLKIEFQNDEEIFTSVPEGMERFIPEM